MKNTLKSAGAFGLAAATILTGLSLGPAAVAAPASSIDVPFKLVYKSTNNGANPWIAVGNDVDTRVSSHSTPEAAAAMAKEFAWNTGSKMISQGAGRCWTLSSGGWIQVETCDDSRLDQKWTPLSSGGFSNANAPALRLNQTGSAADWRPVMTPNAEGEIFLGIKALTASVTGTDLRARSATLTGTAAPDSKVIINGDQQVRVNTDGTWSATVSRLKLGVNTITLEQYEGTDPTAQATVEVDLAVEPVTASTTFDTDVTKKATLSGTAHPGAVVVVEDADGTGIDRAPASPIDGTWELEIPAPNLGGDYPVTVHQLIDGEANGEITETIAYGEAVTITRPVPDAPHAGGPLTMRGTGEAGADVTVREQGSTDVIGSEKVLPNRIWSLDTTDLDDRKHVLEVTQTGKGGNVTTSTITLNPDAVTPVTPVTVAAPVSGTEFDPNTAVRFTGTGENGGIVTLTPTNGAASVTTQVSNGIWTIDRYLGNGPYTFNVTQVAGGVTSSVTGIALTPKSTAPIDLDFAITSPTTGSAVKDQLVTFTGTGAAGTTVRIHTTNFASADITAVVGPKGTWSVNKYIGDGPYVMDITQEGRIEGAVRGFELNNEAGVNFPFAVTTPTAGDDVRSKVQTFTGTGRHGEVVTIKATSPAGLAEVSGVVSKNGTWSINRFIGDGPYAFDVVQTKNGVESGAERDFRINQPAKREGVTGPLVVTGPTDGATFTANTQVAFTGTGTTGAVITVTPTAGAAVTGEVSEDGSWSVNKYLGDGPYTFTVTSTLDGLTETHPGTISLTPAP